MQVILCKTAAYFILHGAMLDWRIDKKMTSVFYSKDQLRYFWSAEDTTVTNRRKRV